ncbi:hypothetical protein [Pseudomonas sp. NMS19W]|uniref:hypothetical protein n=1 Tax=Pseudomonas sp. NMS19W TaxID=3079768 RepID=UPI003F65EEDD
MSSNGSTQRDKNADGSRFQTLDKLLSFIEKHNWKLFKVASLAFGFLIFLVYFCQNGFYPDFDLFSFASLLAAAALIGGAVVALVSVGLVAPGWFWSELFFEERSIREELKKHFNDEKSQHRLNHRLVIGYFLLPTFLCQFVLVIALYYTQGGASGLTIGLFISPLIVSLLFGAAIQRGYSLPSGSWWKFAITALGSVFLSNLIAMLFSGFAAARILPTHAYIGQYPFMAAGLFITLLTFTLLTIALRDGKRYALILGPLLAIAFMASIRTWEVLPSNIVKQLGIGNYEAEQLLLDDDLCEKYKAIESYGLKNDCALNDVHVVWSMGGLSVVKWQFNGKEIKVKISSDSILSTKVAVQQASPKS